MCGIAGLSLKRSLTEQNGLKILKQMADSISHRGPDADGFFIDKNSSIFFGHKRLSIIDIENGSQPMSTEDKNLTIIFNGEIYNYLEIKENLIKAGRVFKNKSDTEVLLQAYNHWGKDCLDKLNGMFSFAIWDKKNRELFIARDRLGIKPLYYYYNDNNLIFASEAKAIIASDIVKPVLNRKCLSLYLKYGFVPGDETLFSGIKKLKPGYFMLLKAGKLSTHQWWDTDPSDKISGKKALHALPELLADSVKLRLRSDVPVGTLLSGGVDSSAIVSMLNKAGCDNADTFSVGFDFGKKYNELDDAKYVSDLYGTTHHEMLLDSFNFENTITKATYHMDEPIIDRAVISLYNIAGLASKHVKTALSGEGSDEIFAGYSIYNYMLILSYLDILPLSMRRLTDKILNLAKNTLKLSTLKKAQKYLILSLSSPEKRYKGPHFMDQNISFSFLRRGLTDNKNFDLSEAYAEDIYGNVKNSATLDKYLYFDLKSWLPNNILLKSDKMSMAHSLELRIPFLDHRIVELAAKLPQNAKINLFRNKYILKKVMKNNLPDRIIYKKKKGFPTPAGEMIKSNMSQYYRDKVLSPLAKINTIVEADMLKKAFNEHATGKRDWTYILWMFLILEEWLEVFKVEL